MNEGWMKKKIRASDCVDYALTYMFRDRKGLIPLLLIFHFPLILIQKIAVSQYIMFLFLEETEDSGMAEMRLMLAILFGELSIMLFWVLFKNVVSGGMVYSAYRYTMFGESPKLGVRVKNGFKFVLTQLVYSFIIGTASTMVVVLLEMLTIFGVLGAEQFMIETEAGSVVIIVAFILFGLTLLFLEVLLIVKFAYMNPLTVIERRNPIRAVFGSWKATKGYGRRILCVYIVFLLVFYGINSAVAALDAFNIFNSSVIVTVVSAVLSTVSYIALYIKDLALAFSYMHDMPQDDRRLYEHRLELFLRDRNV